MSYPAMGLVDVILLIYVSGDEAKQQRGQRYEHGDGAQLSKRYRQVHGTLAARDIVNLHAPALSLQCISATSVSQELKISPSAPQSKPSLVFQRYKSPALHFHRLRVDPLKWLASLDPS